MPNSSAVRLLQSLFLATLLVVPAATRAQDLAPPPPGTVRITLDPGPPGADSYVSSLSPGTNYGAGEYYSAGLSYYAAFCRFDLAGLVATDSTVVQAQIALRGAYMGTGTLYLSPVASAWDEMTVTWNNQPAGIPALQVGYPISRGTPSGPCYWGCVWAFDVTTIVQQWVAGVIPNHGFRITADTPGIGWRIESFESTVGAHPVLVVDYASVTPVTSRSWGSIKTIYR